ncbi:hypothetical protein OOZ15_18385 [Galbibacter sp. EGI 63066]|uniref:hypothetical protein n=1 Tax=Galbibacter sp. EGI 63066 TaxID=2993559 RepID=UPI002248F6EA|nr:hypothetical protein [Galbibacter sp. EGI 63066]MCX2681926.1 hypothetical protein [Galbibacter sp. EGI 63066]
MKPLKAQKYMRKYSMIFMFCILGITKIMSQTPDVAVSYALREIQILLAKQYDRELRKNLPLFSEYLATNTIFYETTKSRSVRAPSLTYYSFPTNPCIGKWGPIKRNRCIKKVELLRRAKELVSVIPVTATKFTPKSAVQSRVMVKVNSILKEIHLLLNDS